MSSIRSNLFKSMLGSVAARSMNESIASRGDVFEGLAIANTIADLKARTVVEVIGVAASIASNGAAAAALAGVAGGVVHWIVNRKNPRAGILAVVVGGMTAVYIGPFASSIIGLPIVAVNAMTGGDADGCP